MTTTHIRAFLRDNREFMLIGLPLCTAAAYTSLWLFLSALFFLLPFHLPYFWLFDPRF